MQEMARLDGEADLQLRELREALITMRRINLNKK